MENDADMPDKSLPFCPICGNKLKKQPENCGKPSKYNGFYDRPVGQKMFVCVC